MRAILIIIASGVVVSSALTGLATAQASRPAPKSAEARLQAIEDKAAIHAVMMSYGCAWCARSFAGSADLSARDGESAAGASSAKGPSAIRELLEGLLQK